MKYPFGMDKGHMSNGWVELYRDYPNLADEFDKFRAPQVSEELMGDNSMSCCPFDRIACAANYAISLLEGLLITDLGAGKASLDMALRQLREIKETAEDLEGDE